MKGFRRGDAETLRSTENTLEGLRFFSAWLCGSASLRRNLSGAQYHQRDPQQVRQKQVKQFCAESKTLLYSACDRLGLKYWKSAANFVLVRAGDRTAELVQAAAERRIYIRDRSTEPGCAGCVRIAAGIVEHTTRCIQVMEEILCAAR